MATIATDLTDYALAEAVTDTTGVGGTWSQFGSGGGTGFGAGVDFAMQGTNAVDLKVSNSEKGAAVTLNSAQTLGTGDHVFVWTFIATPGLTDSIQNKGSSIIVGSASNAYVQYHVAGNDTFGAQGRVGRCYPIDYSVRTSNASAPYRTTSGTAGATPQYIGHAATITGTVKGNNVACDAVRAGTGIYVTAGTVGAPATFSEAATSNDNVSNRWGVLTSLGGTAYELQGYFVIGQDSSQTPTQAYFADSGASITFIDTIHAASDFTRVVVDHASTTCNLDSISFSAAGSTNRGRFIVNNASSTVALTGCSFGDMNITTLQAGVTATGCTWRACEKVTQNSATLTNCNFTNSTAAVALEVNSLNDVTGCSFTSAGTGHAVDLGTISSSTSVSWDCTDSGYAGTNGSTGNETILVNVASGQTLTINVTSNGTTPTYYNTGSGTVSIVSGAVTVKVTVNDSSGSPIQNARVYLTRASDSAVVLSGLTNASGVIQDTAYTYTADDNVSGWARKSSASPYYKEGPISGTITSTGFSGTAILQSDE